MKKNIKFATLICAALLAISFLFGCKNSEEQPGLSTERSTSAGTATYSVEVKTIGNIPLSHVNICVYKDETMKDMLCVQRTDENGRASFEAAQSDGYVVVLKDTPEGYGVKENYSLGEGMTEIILETEIVPFEDMDNTVLKLGDVIKDFTVTGTDGTAYTISELLKEKKAVVLNFWFLTCDPCRMEFPFLETAYEKYSDDVAVIAMNPMNTDDTEIEKYRSEQGLTFCMAQCDYSWEMIMQLTGYPTTVVIDRYGIISMIHRGSVTDAETFEMIFEYFVSDEYSQTVLKGIEEIDD